MQRFRLATILSGARRGTLSGALVGPLAGPPAAHAQQLPYQPAPVPNDDPGRVDPALRAGGASDAGPTNANPFSGVASPVLTGTQAARALRATRPDVDPSPTDGGNTQP